MRVLRLCRITAGDAGRARECAPVDVDAVLPALAFVVGARAGARWSVRS